MYTKQDKLLHTHTHITQKHAKSNMLTNKIMNYSTLKNISLLICGFFKKDFNSCNLFESNLK